MKYIILNNMLVSRGNTLYFLDWDLGLNNRTLPNENLVSDYPLIGRKCCISSEINLKAVEKAHLLGVFFVSHNIKEVLYEDEKRISFLTILNEYITILIDTEYGT